MTAETRLVDYSFARPPVTAIRRGGYVGVLRYLGGSKEKQLTRAEAKALHKAGLAIGLVYESTANRARAGKAAGRDDAAAALTLARSLGYPDACPIFLAVDFDATLEAVAPYFQGAKTVLGGRLGVYGGIDMMELPVVWKWQTAAWSQGRLSGAAHLFQRVKALGALPAGADEDVVCHAIPLWGPKGVVTIAPPSPPAPAKPAVAVRPPNVEASLNSLRKVRRGANQAGNKGRASAAQKLINQIKSVFPGKKG